MKRVRDGVSFIQPSVLILEREKEREREIKDPCLLSFSFAGYETATFIKLVMKEIIELSSVCRFIPGW